MNLKDIMLSGIRQRRKENTVLSQLYVESIKVQLIKQQNLDCQELAVQEMGCGSAG